MPNENKFLLDIAAVQKHYHEEDVNVFLSSGWVLLDEFTQKRGPKDYEAVYIIGRPKSSHPGNSEV